MSRLLLLLAAAALPVVFALRGAQPASVSGAVAAELPTQLADTTNCTALGNATACLGGSCSWCRSAAIPSACYTDAQAATLPPGVFTCGNATQTTCGVAKTATNCAAIPACVWCHAAAIPSACWNFLNATHLPPAVWQCQFNISSGGPAGEGASGLTPLPAATA
jgi:hypothetical protein